MVRMLHPEVGAKLGPAQVLEPEKLHYMVRMLHPEVGANLLKY